MQKGKERWITDISVPEVEKRRFPSKHYMYIVNVKWSDGTSTVIYRRYSRFFDFQNELLDKFPLEAGLLDPNQRIIPFLPGKIYFGRSHVRDVAVKRLEPIHQYCKALISLPAKIAQCEDVLDFFEVEPEDIVPVSEKPKMKSIPKTIEKITGPKLAEEYVVIGDYKKEDKWDLNLTAGMVVAVVEKSESGWWFVTIDEHQGWVPSTYLKRNDGRKENTSQRLLPGQEEKYTVTEGFVPTCDDEITLEVGTVVDVVEKNLDGWWLIRVKGKEGWGPATYLMKAEKAHIERTARQSGVQVVNTLGDISTIMTKRDGDEAVGGGVGPGIGKKLPFKKQKTRSLERGGSIRPPPRQQSIKNIQLDVTIKEATSKVYITVADFQDTVGDGLSFKKGKEVTISDKGDGGWWFGEIDGVGGWIPSSYVQEVTNTDTNTDRGDSIYEEVPEPPDDELGERGDDDDGDNLYENLSDQIRYGPDYLEPVNFKEAKKGRNTDLKSKFSNTGHQKPSTGPVISLPKLSSVSHDTESENASNVSVSKTMKSKFEKEAGSTKPFTTSKPVVLPKDSHTSSNSQNQDRGSSNLADVLKAKFESRQSAASDQTSSNVSESKTVVKKTPLMPPVKPKLKSATSPREEVGSTENGRPRTSEKPKPLKPMIPNKLTPDKGSEFKNVLAAKIDARKSGATTSSEGINSARSKPAVHTKQNTENNDFENGARISTSALKSKFENNDVNKPSAIPMKPRPKSSSQGPQFQHAKPSVPDKKTHPKTAMKPKPLVSLKPSGVSESNSFTKTQKEEFIATADFFGENEGEVSFCAGDVVNVKEKLDTGWWLVSINDNEGWAPATYLQQV